MSDNTFWSIVSLVGAGLMVLPQVAILVISANTGTSVQESMGFVRVLAVIGLGVCLVGAYKVTKC